MAKKANPIRANVSDRAKENINVIQANATIAGLNMNKDEVINFIIENFEFKGVKSFKK